MKLECRKKRNRPKKKRKVLSFSRDIDIHAFFDQI